MQTISSLLIVFLMIVCAGCIGYVTCPLTCEDQNPCTKDLCEKGTCQHKPLNGPQASCMQKNKDCTQSICMNGTCSTLKREECCPNHQCDGAETPASCPQDCPPTCHDNIKNQKEELIDCGGPCQPCPTCNDGTRNQLEEKTDCGGPCPPCGRIELGDIEAVKDIREKWLILAEKYSKAIQNYNHDQRKSPLERQARQIKTDLNTLSTELSQLQTPLQTKPLKEILESTINNHKRAVDSLLSSLSSGSNHQIDKSNNLYTTTIENDEQFVKEYNTYITTLQKQQKECFNDQIDPNEEGIDCGGTCARPCSKTYIINKVVYLRNDGATAELEINLTAPAITYQPFQTVQKTLPRFPYQKHLQNDLGTQIYTIKTQLEPGDVREYQITQKVKVYAGQKAAYAPQDESQAKALLASTATQTPQEICELAQTLLAPTITQSVQNIHQWLSTNIIYTPNQQEKGAVFTYTNRQGACDEHSDLFNALASCLSIPTRRITGYLINNTEITGHAWSQYYTDKSWHYAETTIKQEQRGYATSDGDHIIACLTKENCGTSFSYSYTLNPQQNQNKPNLTVDEYYFLEF